MPRRAAILALAAVCAAAWLFTLSVARREFHLTPDAADYLTIARSAALGRGWTMPVKWHWFDGEPAPRPAWGQRSVGWPAVARWAFVVAPDAAPVGAQVINTFLMGLAAALWGAVAAQTAGVALAGFVMAALVLVSANTLVVATTALSEPLYLCLLALLALVLGPHRGRAVSPLAAGALAGVVTAGLLLTRPSGPAVVVAVILHLVLIAGRGHARRLLPTALAWGAITAAAVVLIAAVTRRAWGGEPHSLMRAHLTVMDITQGMFGGWGIASPSPAAFLSEHRVEVMQKIGGHLLAYTEALLDTNAVGLLSPLLALVAVGALTRWRAWSILWLLALGHWTAAVLTWATTDTLRLALPVTVCLLPLCLGAGADLVRGAGDQRRAWATAAAGLIAVQLTLGAAGLALKARQLSQSAFPASEDPLPLPLVYDSSRVVCTDSPFRLALRSDLACVVFPFDLPARAAASPALWAHFIADQRVAAFALTSESLLEPLRPLLESGQLALLSIPDPEFLWLAVTP